MNPLGNLRFFGLLPLEAPAVLMPDWRVIHRAPGVDYDYEAPQYAHPDSGIAQDLELASMTTVVSAAYGAWGH